MTKIYGLCLGTHVIASLDIASSVRNNEFLLVLTQFKMCDITVLITVFVPYQVGDDPFCLSIADVYDSYVRLSGYTHLIVEWVVLYTYWCNVFELYAVSVYLSKVLELKPVQPVLYTNKVPLIDVQELVDGRLAFEMHGLYAIRGPYIPSFDKANLIWGDQEWSVL